MKKRLNLIKKSKKLLMSKDQLETLRNYLREWLGEDNMKYATDEILEELLKRPSIKEIVFEEEMKKIIKE